MQESHRKPSLAAHLLVWLAAPAGEWVIGRGIHPSPLAWQWGAEFIAFTTLAILQWRLASARWLATLLWPSLLVLLSALVAGGPTSPLAWQALYLAGLILLTTTLLESFSRHLHVPALLAFLLAFGAPLLSRAVDVAAVQGRLSAGFGGIGADRTEFWFELRGSTTGSPKPGPGGPPIVVISIDTLRLDAARAMKSWKRLAARGTSWRTAVSTSSWTLPAVASMQTGAPVAIHGAGCSPCQSLAQDVPTLAEILTDHGYSTAAVTANPWITRATGMDRGFQTWRDLAGVPPFRLVLAGMPAGLPSRDAVVVADEAIAWLGGHRDSSIYLWVHFLGPHIPYSHSSDPALRDVTAYYLLTGGVLGPPFRASVREAYAKEVEYTDREVGRILDVLEAMGILSSGIVILTSDHGEELWERGGTGHGHSHHREVTEIPLVIAGPGFAPGERPGVVSLVDIAPTLERIVGLRPSGLDLREAIPPGRIVTTYGNLYGDTQRSARDENGCVIGSLRGADEETWQRFDLATDPGEHDPQPVDRADPLFLTANALQPPAPGQSPAVNREALRSLGYAE